MTDAPILADSYKALARTWAASVTVITMLDEPSTTINGTAVRTAGHTVAPVAAEMVRRIGPLLGLEPITDEILPTITARFEPRVEPDEEAAVRLVANQ